MEFSLHLKFIKQSSQLRHSVACKVPDFFSCVLEVFALLGCYASWVGSLLLTFRHSPSVPSSMVELPSCPISPHFKMGMIGCPENLVTNTNRRCQTSKNITGLKWVGTCQWKVLSKNGNIVFLQNVSIYPSVYTVS